jgi:hypothetical protein
MHLTEPFEERFESRVQRVEPLIEAAPADPTPKVGRVFEQVLAVQLYPATWVT